MSQLIGSRVLSDEQMYGENYHNNQQASYAMFYKPEMELGCILILSIPVICDFK